MPAARGSAAVAAVEALQGPRHADLRPVGLVAVLLLGAAGLSAWGWLHLVDARPDLSDAGVAAAPLLLGLALAASSRDDRRQYVARLFAASLMLPLLLSMWAGTAAPGPAAPSTAMQVAAGVAAGTCLLLAWAMLLLWTARSSTRIDPAPSGAPVSVAELRLRIESLASRGWPMHPDAVAGAHLDIRLDVAGDGTRWHAVRIALDAHRHEARVREDLGASGARPRDEAERSMRTIGDPAFDPARPSTRWMSGRVRQATMVEPALLDTLARSAAVRAEGQALPEADPAILDTMAAEARGEHMVSLLAAVVTSAGWTWQPVLLDRGKG